MKKDPVFSSAGQISFKTFRQFLEMVPVENVGDRAGDEYEFTTRTVSYGVFLSFDSELEDEGAFKKQVKYFGEPSDKALLRQLMTQATLEQVLREPAPKLVESAAVEHAMQFGTPTVAVRLGARRWMIADPEDFRIVKNDRGSALLACHYSCRLRVVEVLRMTKVEAMIRFNVRERDI